MRRVVSTIGLLVLAWTIASAGPVPSTRLEVFLDDPTAPRVDTPWVVPEVEAAADTGLRDGLVEGLDALVHVRVVDDPAAADYILAVRLGPTVAAERGVATLGFEATLTTPEGRRLWAARGSSRLRADAPAGEAARGIVRNVLDALVRGGWVRQRIDEDDPPPPAPEILRHAP